jgi:S1-C subfamily serine protease
VQVIGVQTGSPAASAHLAAGDVIVSIDGAAVQTPDDVVAALADHQPGDRVTLVWQDATGTSRRGEVKLSSR